jgi:uncharacterized membrane protein YgdD (TMEM256/DUF423 family)
MSPSSTRLRITALLGLAGIILGALGAHGHIHDVISTNGYLDQWQTAAHYHQLHAVALLILSLLSRDASGSSRFLASFVAFIAGILLFSGSLYLLAYTSTKWLGAVTPFGGLAFMIGWLLLARPPRKSA